MQNAVRLQYGNVYRQGQAVLDNQRPDKRNSTIFVKRVQEGAYCSAAYLVDLYIGPTLKPPG